MRNRRLLLIGIVAVAGTAAVWFWLRRTGGDGRTAPQQQFAAGMDAIKRDKIGELLEAIRRLEGEPGYEAHARVLTAGLLLKTDKPAAAIRKLQFEPATRELRVAAGLLRAEACYRLHDLTGAEAAARSVAREDPDNADAHRWLATVFYDLGATSTAVRELRRVVALDPDDDGPHFLMGQIAFDAEDYAGAVKSLRAALERNPPASRRGEVVELLARSLIKTHAYSAAIELLDGVPRSATLDALAGEAWWGLGQPERARRCLQRAAAQDPRSRFVRLLKARMAMEAGAFRQAAELLQAQLRDDPHDFECRYRLAQCYRKLPDPQRYEAEVTRMDEIRKLRLELSRLSDEAARRPEDAAIRDRIASLFEKLGRPQTAEVYRRAAEACRKRNAAAAIRSAP